MKSSFSFLIFAALFASAFPATAQVGLEGFSSGRYEVRKANKRSPASEAEATPVITDSEGVAVRTLKTSELEAEKKAEAEKKEKELAAKKEAEAKAAAETQAATAASVAPAAAPKVAGAEASPEVEEPTIGEQAESLFSDKASKIFEFYREQIHEDDIRNNRLELDVMPVVAYNDSQSNYTFRDYQSFFNALKIRSNVWFTPLIGVSGQILFSFAADVDSVQADQSRVSAKYEFVDLGLNFRKFFGVSRKSNSLEFSLLLSDNKMTVPSDNTSRARIKTQGLGVGLKARIPTSANYAWTLGGSFFPRLQHSESATGVNIQSGASEESVRIGLDVGGEWKFTRESQMIWSLGASAERNVFDGAAGLPDPGTGLTPNNVSVTNSLYMFSLGYRWGH
ncbi:hypothetical protein AB1A81_00270 [Bdellovibrio bacteriovorus]|uniref:Outer membrane protein beta-barrel domain-containing protein n=1 Tax=Bdellovibrio bacteriovorus (strain ATCC 15356 / DSM 50701 / NCIMB 9529 / HD100) TaxID=264462 RepID=Q6MRH9_BDEBA|nr:hypothetical protein [Bdellovibrio bacteriovorus]CAE77779.1 conserved hypothetical protein [Bdellovibrio bacteriovorus HD100]